jgi:hypothetical protein
MAKRKVKPNHIKPTPPTDRRLKLGAVEGVEPPLRTGDAVAVLTELLHFQISTKLLRRWSRAGSIPCVRVGRSWLYFKSELEAWKKAGGGKPSDDDALRERLLRFLAPRP